jgi:hypothetical protein
MPSRQDERRLLLRADVLSELGRSAREICDELHIKTGELRSMRKRELLIFSIPGPWQLVHKGKTWEDMPGFDWYSKRCNFALYRRGIVISDGKAHGKLKIRFRGRAPRNKKPDEESEIENAEIAPVSPDLSW